MKEKINQELGRLQKELGKLENAVKQIQRAEEISSEVVNAVKILQEKYANGFINIESKTDKFLSDSLTANEKKINNFIESNKKENERVLNVHKKHVNEIISSQKKQIAESKKIISDLQRNVKQNEQKNISALQKHTEETKKIVNKLIYSHKQQINEVNTLLDNYLSLAKSTAQLSDKIDTIDFPKKLDNISTNIDDMNLEIRKIQENIKKIETDETLSVVQKKIKRANKRTNFTIFLAFVIIIMLFALGYELVFIKYFPDLKFY